MEFALINVIHPDLKTRTTASQSISYVGPTVNVLNYKKRRVKKSQIHLGFVVVTLGLFHNCCISTNRA